ncbi:hypothetical protein D3C75_1100320 [compost metagenome]
MLRILTETALPFTWVPDLLKSAATSFSQPSLPVPDFSVEEKISTKLSVLFATDTGNLEMSGSESPTEAGSRSICPLTGLAAPTEIFL